MDAPVRDWLPAGAFSEEAIRGILSDALANWSTQWFPGAIAEISGVRTGESALPSDAEARIVAGKHVRIAAAGAGTRRLLQQALGVDLNVQLLWDNDRNVLDSFVGEALRDLIVRVDVLFGDAPSEDRGTPPVAAITIAEGELFALFLPAHLLVPRLKSRCGKPRTGGTPAPRIEALRRVRLTAFGHIGYAELSMSEVGDLAVGDVLVLDRGLSDPVELRLPEGGRPLAQGTLCRNDGHFSIQL